MKSTHLRCCASLIVIAAYYDVRLIPQGSHTLLPVGFTVGYADLEKRPPQEAGADLKKGFLSDSFRESPQEIGIADRPEAGTGIFDHSVLIGVF
jgi:hypothetical protein